MIVVGLGGNVGGDAAVRARFAAAAGALAALGPVRASRVYRTAPIGPAQPPYLNAAVALAPDPAPSPEDLAALLFAVERSHGRRREAETRWGPRTLDLDVLLWDGRAGRWPLPDGGVLEVPHPRLTQRRFALAPLADLLGAAAVVAGRPLAAWLAEVADQPVEPADDPAGDDTAADAAGAAAADRAG